ncbi:hypothetical protein OH76DRAFT_704204 [Lentinus brumalis]|uniref:Uncharacterized protein n=1 Tax=Lentinus brumalis TaxID=2498619 RepID=A0A371D5S3_9APHY|nr:hypothetical protein OH76DRAFT_704204 [Polyporus brumalis]
MEVRHTHASARRATLAGPGADCRHSWSGSTSITTKHLYHMPEVRAFTFALKAFQSGQAAKQEFVRGRVAIVQERVKVGPLACVLIYKPQLMRLIEVCQGTASFRSVANRELEAPVNRHAKTDHWQDRVGPSPRSNIRACRSTIRPSFLSQRPCQA